MLLKQQNELEYFWDNVDKYIQDNTIDEQIDNLFPFVLFDNDVLFNEYFEQIKLTLKEIYNTTVDIYLTYGDICRAIVNNMKNVAKELKTLNFDILTEIILTIFEVALHKAILEEEEKNDKLNTIISSLKENN